MLPGPYIFDDFSSGMIDTGAVSDSLLPKNAVRKAINCVFDNPRGSVTGRLGSAAVGNNIGSAVKGIGYFRDAGSGTNHQLLATDNGGITYYLNGSTFTSTLSGDTAAKKTYFVTFLDTIARLNGTDAIKSWDGNPASAWATSGGALDVGNWPSATKYAEVFNSRVYTSGQTSAPDTLYYSSIPSGNAISWTSGNGSLLVNPNDGESGITGIKTNGTVLLIFKRNSLYRWDGQATFANKVISIGTPSTDSLALHDSGWMYFFGTGKSTVGAFRTTGSYPQKISTGIERWFEAIPASAYENVASFVDDDHYYLSVGSITVDGVTYSNAWFVYTISLQAWHIENRAHSLTVFSNYTNTSSTQFTVGGDSAGNVHQINSGTLDLTTPIAAECEFSPISLTTRGRTKRFSSSNVVAYASQFQGVKFFVKTDKHNFESLGQMSSESHRFNGRSLMFNGKQFFPKITVSDSALAWQFDGFEISNVTDEDIYN